MPKDREDEKETSFLHAKLHLHSSQKTFPLKSAVAFY